MSWNLRPGVVRPAPRVAVDASTFSRHDVGIERVNATEEDGLRAHSDQSGVLARCRTDVLRGGPDDTVPGPGVGEADAVLALATVEQETRGLRQLRQCVSLPRWWAHIIDLRPLLAVPGPGVAEERIRRSAAEQDDLLAGAVVHDGVGEARLGSAVLDLCPEFAVPGPRVAERNLLTRRATEEHDRSTGGVEGHGVSEATTWARVPDLSPECSVPGPRIRQGIATVHAAEEHDPVPSRVIRHAVMHARARTDVLLLRPQERCHRDLPPRRMPSINATGAPHRVVTPGFGYAQPMAHHETAPTDSTPLPGTRDELITLHRETRRKRNAAEHGSPEHVAAIDLLGPDRSRGRPHRAGDGPAARLTVVA